MAAAPAPAVREEGGGNDEEETASNSNNNVYDSVKGKTVRVANVIFEGNLKTRDSMLQRETRNISLLQSGTFDDVKVERKKGIACR